MNEDTGFKDKSGKPIHVGDTIQIKLNSKTGGRWMKRIVRDGKKFKVVNADDFSDNPIGYRLQAETAQRAVIIDRAH
jgi:hypothetical protein